jgi:hypothetical protein
MSTPAHRTARLLARAVPLAAAVVGLGAALPASLLSIAAAAGPYPTTTTVQADPATAAPGEDIEVSATVYLAGPANLNVTPKGTVDFTASQGDTTTDLGTASLRWCWHKTCLAEVDTSTLGTGSWTITADYDGNRLAATSEGMTTVSVTATDGQHSTVSCDAESSCDTGTVTSPDGQSSVDVVADPSSQGQTVSASIEPGTLHCPGDTDEPTGGDEATFSSTATDAGKTITYTGINDVGIAMEQNYASHTTYVGCFASTTPFFGYTDGVYGPATQVDEQDGTYYEAQLSNCANNSGATPCFTNEDGTDSESPFDTYTIKAPAGDPKFTP